MAAPKEKLGPHTNKIVNTDNDGIVISTENILNTQNTIKEKQIDFALGDEPGIVYIVK